MFWKLKTRVYFWKTTTYRQFLEISPNSKQFLLNISSKKKSEVDPTVDGPEILLTIWDGAKTL